MSSESSYLGVVIKDILIGMSFLSDEERLEIINAIKSEFCEHCGRKQPDKLAGCQCLNDE